MKHLENEKKIFPLFFVIDTSGGGAGEYIISINEGMKTLINNLKANAESYGVEYDSEVRIAVLVYSSDARWVTSSGLEQMSDFEWNYLTASGLSNLGVALLELQSKLSRRGFLCVSENLMIPAIIYIVEGSSTDDYNKQLNVLRENNEWFNRSHKICIGFNYPDKQMIDFLVDSEDYMKIAGSPEELKEIIGNQLTELLPKFMDTRAKVYEETKNEIKDEKTDDLEDDTWA
jgi:uncharacterized protein encoded in toxicity protection region of plasmid R478, contains von willebrand factor (VWF) domain